MDIFFPTIFRLYSKRPNWTSDLTMFLVAYIIPPAIPGNNGTFLASSTAERAAVNR
jgi:hypothetical protein